MRLRSVLSVLALLAACGKEIGRVPFTTEGTSTATVTFDAGEIAFWTDIDVDYEGDAAAAYRVELLQGGKVVASTDCNPLGHMSVKLTWVQTSRGRSHSRSGKGKMACSVTLEKAGPTLVKAQLTIPQGPTSLALKKADLVFKQ